MDLNRMAINEIRDNVRAKKVSALEVVRHFQKRSELLNPKLNAFISINQRAEEQAKALDKRISNGDDPGPLAGVPIAVKDLLCTKGLLTTAASKMLANYVPPYSATLVEKLEAAGAIILGKANLDEFAMGSSNETSAFGSAKNPWDTKLVPGGSSGGSAVAVAASMTPAAIGTDTGGSIRQPASYCGVAGIKPTYGRVSRYGIIAYASSLDQAGPMAANVADAATLLEVIAGFDPKDSTSAQQAVPNWSKNISENLSGMTVGLPKEYFSDGVDKEIRNIVEKAVDAVQKQGAKIKEVSLPHTKYAISTYYLIATSEASSNLARYDGIRYGFRAQGGDVDELYKNSRGAGFGSEVKRRIVLGTYALSSGYYDAYYKKACQVRRLFQNDFLEAFKTCDVLLSPVTATLPFELGGKIKDPLAMYLNDIFTTSTNLAGLPGMSVNGGYASSGLPVGVQLTARHFDEQSIFNVAKVIESFAEKRVPNVL